MTKTPRAHRARIPGSVRLTALVLTALTLCAFLAVRPVRAAEWMTPYLEQVQEWGVMRGDSQGNLHEDRNITRAEFVTLVNRAFGYEEPSPSNPFTDVNPNDWFAEDVSIAHQAGYFNGTSDSTASPYSLVTREQAAVFLGRCLRFQGVSGAASSSFTDMQDIGGWSRPLVQEAAELGIIQGYADGSFRPNLPITRGQMACFLVRALGTLVQEPGEQTSGGVYGNLTITTPGVKLKDTVVTGNLYLTGGVGLGNVELENVSVQGKIIICGGGEAEAGKQSVLLRNVTAGALELDSLTEQFLSIQAEGLTNIGEVTLRTPGYLEDRTEDGLGFQTIRLDGVEGSLFQLAGNIKRVVNLTPESTLQLAQGVADVITMDEKAVDAKLTIDDRASIRELNLDLATQVDGKGSISHLNINAPGSKVTMLPDTIYIRPGITGNVYNQNMDNIAAAESSEDPRLLAGYPKVKDIASTSATAVFSTNKPGTIHWAITALMDGSVGEEDLMNPSSNARILRSGTLRATASNTEITARLTGLTKQGSYYVSALLEDARGRRSPVKIAAFTTPDDSAPNFVSGYPQAPILTLDADKEQVAQIMVMATKDCQMYYALFPRGATAPTAADFRSAALPGNLGYGIVTLRKNAPFLVSRINTSHLQEQTQYDLYLWLNDADNGKSSAVRRVQFTTKDMTPPNILKLEAQSSTDRSVTLSFELSEPGALYWFVTKQGQSVGINKENPTLQNQIMIESAGADGTKIIRRGGPVRFARTGTAISFTVTGLEGETTYDLYYMAKDTAGNYCVYNEAIEFPLPIKTRDVNGPKVEVNYSHSNPGPTEDAPPVPRVDTDLRLEFSEIIRGRHDNSADPESILELYRKVETSSGQEKERAKSAWGRALHGYVRLYPGTPPTRGEPTADEVAFSDGATILPNPDDLPAWIDYREARVEEAGGKTTIVFPGSNSKNTQNGIAPAVKLQSGASYYFRLEDIEDTSDNPMKNTPPNVVFTPSFTIAYATIYLENQPDTLRITLPDGTSPAARVFTMTPEGTEAVPEGTRWDMLIWTEFAMKYDLYIRELGSTTWQTLGTVNANPDNRNPRIFNSLNGNFLSNLIGTGLVGTPEAGGYPRLPEFREDTVLEVAIVPEDTSFTTDVFWDIQVYAGTNADMQAISIRQGSQSNLTGKNVTLINEPTPNLRVEFPAPDRVPTVYIPEDGADKIGSAIADIDVRLRDGAGTVYWMAIKLDNVKTDANGRPIGTDYTMGELLPAYQGNKPDLSLIPIAGVSAEGLPLDAGNPDVYNIASDEPTIQAPRTTQYGNTGDNMWGTMRGDTLHITGLAAESTYMLYLVSTTTGNRPVDNAVCYLFSTTPARPPIIDITPQGSSADIRFFDAESDTRAPLDSVMAYVLVRNDYFTQAGNASDFNRPMSDFQDPNSAYSFNGTVLQAMYQEGPNGLSYFDLCASEQAKASFGTIIRSTYNNVFRLNQETYYLTDASGTRNDFNSGRSYTEQNPSFNITTGNDYVLLVTAQGVNSEVPGFRASWPYRRTQNTYLSVTLQPSEYDTTTPTRFYGTLTLSFNYDLRYRPQYSTEQDRVPIDTCRPGNSNHTSDRDHIANGHRSFDTDLATLSLGVELSDPAPVNSGSAHGSTIGNRLVFSLNGVQAGQILNLGNRLTGSNTSNRFEPPNLIVELYKDDNGNWAFRLTNDIWSYSDRDQ
ncbi:S-layer homology domain-containing protein [uncultured Oscillibacter sp.]|uniref:S-layer homology domain-containing protein n=1 Tax=uncultured Oscillibacter sp. TaxID=876091 RepID=UPI00262811C1|nr:S-layer homology domain-containing protein [uncultured Oscillibacter sp.]